MKKENGMTAELEETVQLELNQLSNFVAEKALEVKEVVDKLSYGVPSVSGEGISYNFLKSPHIHISPCF